MGLPGAIYMYVTIIFKDLFLSNRLTNQSQILYETFIEKENQCVHKQFRSHDQDGRHALWHIIMIKALQNLLSFSMPLFSFL